MVIVGYQWLSLVISGYCWLSAVIVGYSWLLYLIHDYRWLSEVIVGYVIVNSRSLRRYGIYTEVVNYAVRGRSPRMA